MSQSTSCLICHSHTLKHLYTSKGYEIAQCPDCSFCQVLYPPTDDQLDKLYADLHTKHIKFRDAQAAEKENRKRLYLLQAFVSVNSFVLDAGCATGDFVSEAKGRYTMYGVDISPGAIEQAKTRLPELSERLQATRIENIDHDWPTFDAICLWDVIEHVLDPVSTCREMMQLLKPGGYLFLSTPDIESVAAKLMRRNWAFMIPPYHLGFFSSKTFEYLFENVVPAQILYNKTYGKWTSLAFVCYKLNQISTLLAPSFFLEWLAKSPLGRINLYAPTNDIMYVVVQKSSTINNH
jgi:2-polyprenyl-3-methyl-5-hydroxy-6-metoxy-1,4-benzoquinol methylase